MWSRGVLSHLIFYFNFSSTSSEMTGRHHHGAKVVIKILGRGKSQGELKSRPSPKKARGISYSRVCHQDSILEMSQFVMIKITPEHEKSAMESSCVVTQSRFFPFWEERIS
jgi:hypothetical protein